MPRLGRGADPLLKNVVILFLQNSHASLSVYCL